MPIKKMEVEEPHLSVSNVVEIWDLCQLAWTWAGQPLGIDEAGLNRYRDMCDKYGVDPSLLLYTVQRMTMDNSAILSQPETSAT